MGPITIFIFMRPYTAIVSVCHSFQSQMGGTETKLK